MSNLTTDKKTQKLTITFKKAHHNRIQHQKGQIAA